MEKEWKRLFLKYEFAKQQLETELNILIQEYAFEHDYNPVEHIKSRIKSEKSIKEKLDRKKKEYTKENIETYVKDVVGVRIIVSFLNEVFDLVNMIKTSKNIIIEKEENYIDNPKENGYTSYHLDVLVPVFLSSSVEYVKAEIQIRTLAMDFWASVDHKVQYKYKGNLPEAMTESLVTYSKYLKGLDRNMKRINQEVKELEKKEKE